MGSMDSIVMAGGKGRRLGMGEKPLVRVCGKPMIDYVIDALLEAPCIDRVYVAISPGTPGTGKWAGMRNGIEIIQTPGAGFVNDMIFAAEQAGIVSPFMIVMADIPLITPCFIKKVIDKYYESGLSALSVHLKLDAFSRLGLCPDTVFNRDGEFIVPAGINILDGRIIRQEQTEYFYILEDEELTINVNTVEALRVCEKLLLLHSGLAKPEA